MTHLHLLTTALTNYQGVKRSKVVRRGDGEARMVNMTEIKILKIIPLHCALCPVCDQNLSQVLVVM